MIAALNILAEESVEFLRVIIILAIPLGLWIAGRIAQKKEEERKQLEREQQGAPSTAAESSPQGDRREGQKSFIASVRDSLREELQPPPYRPQRQVPAARRPAARPQATQPIELEVITPPKPQLLVTSAPAPPPPLPSEMPSARRKPLIAREPLVEQMQANLVEMPDLRDRQPELPLSMAPSLIAVDLFYRDTATMGIIFQEILGPPKALRTGPDMWDI